jgi:hypothetical protein
VTRWILLVAWLGALPAAAGELRAGAAAVVITPAPNTPMAGYYSARSGDGVHDDLHAKALVLEQDGRAAALVALDLISTDRSWVLEARKLISALTGIPGDAVMISATHAHTGPVVAAGTPYAARLPGLIADVVARARESAVAARLSVGAGREEALAFNRRFHMRDGSVGWNPGKRNPEIVRPAGPTDPEVPVALVDAADGARPLAAYVNFAMHLDTVGGTRVSADYPATLSKILADARGADLITLFTIGTAGDINHVDVSSPAPQKGPGEAARIGARLAASVLRASGELHQIQPGGVRARNVVVPLALPPIDAEDRRRARATLAREGATPPPPFIDQVHAHKVRDVEARHGRPLDAEVQVVALGPDVAWVGLPGEIFVTLGLAIKDHSPFRHTIIAELANGSVGYVPTRTAYPEGAYEVVSARCAPGSGERLVDAALALLRDLHREAAQRTSVPSR